MIKMKIRVRYLGPVRVLLNKKEEELEVPVKTTLIEFLDRLASLYGDAFREEVLETNSKAIREGLVVTVNGIAVNQLGGVKARLNDGDAVTLLPFFAGGG